MPNCAAVIGRGRRGCNRLATRASALRDGAYKVRGCRGLEGLWASSDCVDEAASAGVRVRVTVCHELRRDAQASVTEYGGRASRRRSTQERREREVEGKDTGVGCVVLHQSLASRQAVESQLGHLDIAQLSTPNDHLKATRSLLDHSTRCLASLCPHGPSRQPQPAPPRRR
jgi:hypothetical protein